jgi:hypothetical protein
MTTINKIQNCLFNAIEKKMLLSAILLILILVITYFKPDHKAITGSNGTLSLSISSTDLNSMPRFFLKN